MNKSLQEAPSIKQILTKEGSLHNRAHLQSVGKGYLWYAIFVQSFGLFEFPVPVEDTKDAVFDTNIKAVALMRWIRQALKDGTFVHINADCRDNESGY